LPWNLLDKGSFQK
jgi:hypothetical protein